MVYSCHFYYIFIYPISFILILKVYINLIFIFHYLINILHLGFFQIFFSILIEIIIICQDFIKYHYFITFIIFCFRQIHFYLELYLQYLNILFNLLNHFLIKRLDLIAQILFILIKINFSYYFQFIII